jgi:hypothetical protein
MTLLNHLITKLNPLDDITTTLSSLSGLPEALEQVAVFRETMKTMQDRISNRPHPQPQAQVAQPASIDVNQITKLQETMEEILRKVDIPSGPTVGLDSGKVFGAITGLKRALEEVKTSVSTGSGGEVSGEMKEMRDLVMEMKVEMAGMKDTLANLAQPVPTPAIDHEMTTTLRTILGQLKYRPVPQITNDTPTPILGQVHTPTTGIRPVPDAPQPPDSEDVASPPRVFGRPIRTIPWGQQDPVAEDFTGDRGVQPEPGGEGSDIFGTIQPILSNSITANKKQKTKPSSTLKFTLPIPPIQGGSQGSQSTSSRHSSNGSVTNQRKRKSPPNSLSLRPTTRSCSNRGKEIGIDVINLESSESSGKKRGGVVPETSNSGDTTWPLGLPESIRPEPRGSGRHDQPIEIESPPLPETQDLGQSQSQSQVQTQTQLNNSQIESTFEFGHGQLPSVPSSPGYESTQFETQVDTPVQKEKEVTSTELVEQSLALPPPAPRRAEPGYRKYQVPRTYGSSAKMHRFLRGNFGVLDDSDDEG